MHIFVGKHNLTTLSSGIVVEDFSCVAAQNGLPSAPEIQDLPPASFNLTARVRLLYKIRRALVAQSDRAIAS